MRLGRPENQEGGKSSKQNKGRGEDFERPQEKKKRQKRYEQGALGKYFVAGENLKCVAGEGVTGGLSLLEYKRDLFGGHQQFWEFDIVPILPECGGFRL